MNQLTLHFPPDDTGWQSRISLINPLRYADTRNHLDGAVTGLSPYLTHGYLSLSETVEVIRQGTSLSTNDKLFSEFCWRSFFHHVWAHKGTAIFSDIRPPSSEVSYRQTLPRDIREGCTGLPVIDEAVRQLYQTGYLHNHARMWLASYVVHLRHTHWRAGADWLYSHLLDGDFASNHLSWQWVAGTFSTKPYLFNADNVAKYAPKEWQCKGSPLDTSYEALENIAFGRDQHGQELFEDLSRRATTAQKAEEPRLHDKPPSEPSTGISPAGLAKLLRSRPEIAFIELVHAWALRAISPVRQPREQTLRLGVIHLPEHAQWPWSSRRWNFVLNRMSDICDVVFIGDVSDLKSVIPVETSLCCQWVSGQNETIKAIATFNPRWLEVTPLVSEPSHLCESFSKYVRHTNKTRSK
jgi:deoxyribodipyrimidine photo-lyase